MTIVSEGNPAEALRIHVAHGPVGQMPHGSQVLCEACHHARALLPVQVLTKRLCCPVGVHP